MNSSLSKLQYRIEGPFVISLEKLVKFGSEYNYPNTPTFPFYGSGECPVLPQALMPNLGIVSWWIQGAVLYKGSEADRRLPPTPYERYPLIERGTVIFTPNARGLYNNANSGNHAAIFLRYGVYNGQEGIFVVDQYTGKNPKRPGIRFIYKRTGAINSPSNDARDFAVVLAMRPPIGTKPPPR